MLCSKCGKQVPNGTVSHPDCGTDAAIKTKPNKRNRAALIVLCAALIFACSACADKNASAPNGVASAEPNAAETPDSAIVSLEATAAPSEEPSDSTAPTQSVEAEMPSSDNSVIPSDDASNAQSATTEAPVATAEAELSDFEKLFVDNSITYIAHDFGELESTALVSKNNDLEDIDEYVELIEIAYIGDTVCELIQTVYIDTTNFSDEYSEWLDKETRAQYAEEFKDMPFVEVTYRTEGAWYVTTFAVRDLNEGNNFDALGDESMLSVNDEGKEYLSLSNIEALYLGLGYIQK